MSMLRYTKLRKQLTSVSNNLKGMVTYCAICRHVIRQMRRMTLVQANSPTL